MSASDQPNVLLPCPFCGDAPRRFTSPAWRYSVECVGCGIQKQGMSAEEAAEKWNRRYVVQLAIQPRIARQDHCQVVAVGGEFPIRFVGFVSLAGSHIKVQRCGRCNTENYAPAIISGVCCWCGWDANDPSQAKVVKDNR